MGAPTQFLFPRSLEEHFWCLHQLVYFNHWILCFELRHHCQSPCGYELLQYISIPLRSLFLNGLGLYLWMDSSSDPWSLWALALGPLCMNLYWIHSHLLVSPPPLFPNFDPSYFCSFSLVSACTSSFNPSSTFHFFSPYFFLLVGHTSDFLETFISKSLHFFTIESTKMRCLSVHTLSFFLPQYAKFPYLLKLLHLLCWILSSIWLRASLLQISIWLL